MGLGYQFVCSGSNCTFSYYKDLWRLDTATTLWTRMTDFPGEGRSNAVVFVIGDKAYVTGGSSANHTDMWQYSTSTNTWTQKADFPGCVSRATAFAIGTKGYVGLGQGIGGNCQNFWAYDTSSNAWAKVDSFPGRNRNDAVGFAIGDTGFVIGGTIGPPNFVAEVWSYSATSNTWTQRQTTYPGYGISEMIGGVIAGRIFIGLGTSSNSGGPDTRFADFFEYIR